MPNLATCDSTGVSPGDYIVCIDNSEFPENLTIGKTYHARAEHTTNNCVGIIDDTGYGFGYYKYRFVKVYNGELA